MRYIDADALGIGKADRKVFEKPEYADGWNSAIEIIANAPTADVVPRSEVEKIFGLIDDIVESWKIEDYSKDSGCIVRVSYNGKMIAKCLAELKKKYVGEVTKNV